MSLSTALDTAKSSLAANQAQTAILSRNIANVNVAGATRKYANVVTAAGGGVTVTSISQSANGVLYGNMLEAKAAVGRGNVVANGLNRLNDTIGDTALGRSPAAMIAKFTSALNTLSATPNNYELARNVANAATDLAATITSASETVQNIRRDADKELVNAAADMTRILGDIEKLNKEIISGTQSGSDITDLADERDRAVAELSQYVAVTVRTRGQNDMVLYTDSGVTLFETTARKVEFSQTPGLNATVGSGNAFRIDGIPVTGDTAYMPLKSGSVAGLVALRDDIMVTYQTQLDEMARGLIQATKETKAGFPNMAGLFTSTDPTALATALTGSDPVPIRGLAATLQVASVVAATPERIRDGIAYDYNTTDAGSFSARLNAMFDSLAAQRSFAPDGGSDSSASLVDYAASSMSWLQASRKSALSETEYKTTLLQSTQTALSNETGINMDEQLTHLTEIQRSYQASAKLITTIDEMLATLLQSI